MFPEIKRCPPTVKYESGRREKKKKKAGSPPVGDEPGSGMTLSEGCSLQANGSVFPWNSVETDSARSQ